MIYFNENQTERFENKGNATDKVQRQKTQILGN